MSPPRIYVDVAVGDAGVGAVDGVDIGVAVAAIDVVAVLIC